MMGIFSSVSQGLGILTYSCNKTLKTSDDEISWQKN